ncbi:MAG: hypothetical protein HYY17_05620 [Planctomycetes bacterium]|nr:hypothetical protein [Planctomycetota bacterium]
MKPVRRLRVLAAHEQVGLRAVWRRVVHLNGYDTSRIVVVKEDDAAPIDPKSALLLHSTSSGIEILTGGK